MPDTDAMANRAESEQRLNWCFQQLLKCRPTCTIVAELSEREGISRRQARRYVADAYAEMITEIEEVNLDRKHMLVQTVHALQTTIERGVSTGNGAVVIGAIRMLDQLVGLGMNYSEHHRRMRYARPS